MKEKPEVVLLLMLLKLFVGDNTVRGHYFEIYLGSFDSATGQDGNKTGDKRKTREPMQSRAFRMSFLIGLCLVTRGISATVEQKKEESVGVSVGAA